MVFQKLTDEQKQKLFDLGETHGRTAISSMRALIMRGSSVDEAQKIVRERRQAKYDYMEQVENKRREAETESPVKPMAKTRAKKSLPAIEEKSPETESPVKPMAKTSAKKHKIEEATITILS